MQSHKLAFLNPLNVGRNLGLNLRFNRRLDLKRLILISNCTQLSLAKTARIRMAEQLRVRIEAHSRESTHSISLTESHSVLASAHSTLMASKLLLLTAITTPNSSPRRTTAPIFAMGRF